MFCLSYSQDAAESGKEDSETGSLMSCLISNKFHAEMNNKCRAGIEHHQLVGNKNVVVIIKAIFVNCKLATLLESLQLATSVGVMPEFIEH